ncbi:MAG: hypothetical protein DHS80DRAFT_22709 [Piptocephalis tieghemiana]|nr:MAG: hypothetical protein DHS80DRAFT_22709 [Piptocephalis tieghemiana]
MYLIPLSLLIGLGFFVFSSMATPLLQRRELTLSTDHSNALSVAETTHNTGTKGASSISQQEGMVVEAPSSPQHGFLYELGDGMSMAAVTGPIFQAPMRSANEAMTRALASKYANSNQEYEDAVLEGRRLLQEENVTPESRSPLEEAQRTFEEVQAYKSEKKGHPRHFPIWAKDFYRN